MVDISGKLPTDRTAVATGDVRMGIATLRQIEAGNAPKGDVLGVARLAGIQAAKRTSELIPLTHPLALTHVDVDCLPDRSLPGVRIRASVRCTGPTGAEMEALTAVAVAGLTLIDMAKSMDRWMVLEGIGLEEKRGGKGGLLKRPARRRALASSPR
jgi:cyclic pyranopterin phosphate synthase